MFARINCLALLLSCIFSPFYAVGQAIDTTTHQGLLDFATLKSNEGKFEEALRLVDKVVGLNPPNSRDGLMAKLQEGDILQSMGQMEAALNNHIEIHDQWVIHHDTTAAEFGLINYYLGTRYFRLSNYPKAIKAYKKTVSILPDTDDLHWKAQNELLTIHANQGDFEAALKTFPLLLAQREEKLRLARQAPESPKREKEIADRISAIGTMKANQGIVFFNTGNIKEAVPTYEEGVRLIEEAYGSQNRLYLDYAPVLLIIYRSIGQIDRALEFGQELWKASLKAGSPAEAAFVGDALATIYQQMDQNNTALSYLLTADSLYLAGEKEHSLERASSQLNLGKIYKNLGRYEEGLTALGKSIKIMEYLSATEHNVAKLSLILIAEIKGKQGKYAEQIDRLVEAKNSSDPLFKNNINDYTALLTAKALAHEQLGQLTLATQEYQELYQLFSKQITAQFDAFSEEEQLSWQKILVGAMHQAQNFMLRHPAEKEMAGTAFNLDLLFRGIAFGNRKRLFERIRNSSFAEINDTYEQWLTTRNELSTQYRRPVSDRSPMLDSIENEAIRLEKTLARQSQAFKVAREQPTWNKINQQLAPDEVFINFVHTSNYDFDERLPGKSIFALIVRGDGSTPEMIPLPGLGDLQKLAATKSLYAAATTTNTLRQLIFEPLRPYLTGIKHISYAPADVLHRVNFGAIPVSSGATISGTYSLSRVSQINDWLFAVPSPDSPPHKAVLFGGIDFESNASESVTPDASTPAVAQAEFSRSPAPDSTALRTLSQDGWSELAYTASEVKEIANRLRRGDYQTTVLEKDAGTEEAFKQLGAKEASPKVLHLATHGYFFPKANTLKEQDPAKTGFETARHPLVRSGLILAGANRTWRGESIPDGQEDGILTAYEIAEMDLSNTELVVLSACETGLGDIDGSEGVFGLQRAFKMAGAKYVLMSLWNVKDQKTYEFMTTFYDLWQSGNTIPEAYQETQSKMRTKYALPFAPRNWAGFVLLH